MFKTTSLKLEGKAFGSPGSSWIFWVRVLFWDEGSHHIPIPIIPVLRVIQVIKMPSFWAGRITWKHGPRKSHQVSHLWILY